MITHDELAKQIDIENLLKMDRGAGGHDEQMQGLIKGAQVIAHWNEGDYQGQVATIVRVPSGEFLVYNDFYGSCSGCDAWEDAKDDDVKKMCNDLVYTAKIFNTLKEVFAFLEGMKGDEEGSYAWGKCADGLLEELWKTFEAVKK